MIKKLRRQFIGGSLISIFVVLSAILFIGNMILYNSVNSRSDNKLRMILDNGGDFPQKGMKMKYHSTHIQNENISETITHAHVYEEGEG